MSYNAFWRVVGIFLLASTAITIIYVFFVSSAYFLGFTDRPTSRPTPAPIVRHCINRQRVIDEVTDRFFEEVHLLDPNDVSVLNRYTRRPSGSLFTDEEKINMLIYSIVFQAQKPGTGKYLKGRYDVYFENDVACKIQFTELDW